MIFQHTYQQVLDSTKTQTRRIVKPGEAYHWIADAVSPTVKSISACSDFWTPETSKGAIAHTAQIKLVTSPNFANRPAWKKRKKWHIGETYAVQPHFGQKAIARIRITGIRQERVQDISEDDVEAEGVAKQRWATNPEWPATAGYAALWDAIHTKRGERWANNPAVWVLEFELVREAVAA